MNGCLHGNDVSMWRSVAMLNRKCNWFVNPGDVLPNKVWSNLVSNISGKKTESALVWS